MAKNSKSKLTENEQQALLVELCQAMVSLKKPEEAARFLQDLLSAAEAEMLAKRVKIAKLLINGSTYEEVQRDLKVAKGTVARVSTWLALSGDGFRLVEKRSKSSQPSAVKESVDDVWRMMKRRYPLHLWPEILIEEIFKSASVTQKDKLKMILDRLGEKEQVFAELQKKLQLGRGRMRKTELSQ